MLLRGKLAKFLVKADPSIYREYVTTLKNGLPILYVKLTKVLYGTLRAALLFYKKLRGNLEDIAFVINIYAPCVKNRMVNGSHVTVI